MKVLFLHISNPPEIDLKANINPSFLTSIPNIYLENNLVHSQFNIKNINQAIELTNTQKAELIVLIGKSELTKLWKEVLEKHYPNIIMVESEPTHILSLLDKINEYIWDLRQLHLSNMESNFQMNEQLNEQHLQIKFRQSQITYSNLLNTYKFKKAFGYLPNNMAEKNLYCLDLLDQHVMPLMNEKFNKILDVGVKEWSYVASLSLFYRQFSNDLDLKGLEIDPCFINENGLTRGEQANLFATKAKARFLLKDFYNFNEEQDLISFFLPIILKDNAIKWRMPLKFHRPELLFRHAYQLLSSHGLLIIYNGVAIEYNKTLLLLSNSGLKPVYSKPHICRFRKKQHGFITLLQK